MDKISYGDKIFKLLQQLERDVNKPDLHSFTARAKNGMVFVEARQGDILIEHERKNGSRQGWCGTCIAAANRLEMLGLDLNSVSI